MNILSYNGQKIEQRIDGYVNATQMAQSNNIRIADWLENDNTKKYLKAIQKSISAEFGTNDKIIQIKGFGSEKATWVHPLVAIGFAQWISPEFHVWCNIHIKTLIETGKTELVEQPIRKLPQRDTIEYVEAQEKIEKINNATLKELLRDQLIDELSILRGKTLSQAKPTEYTILTTPH